MALSKSKSIRREPARSMAHNVENKDFLYFGHDCNTSKADMAAKSFLAHLVGPLAIIGKGSIGIFDMVKGIIGALVIAHDELVFGGVS